MTIFLFLYLFRNGNLVFSPDMNEYRLKICSEIFCGRLFFSTQKYSVFYEGANDLQNEELEPSNLNFVTEVLF